MPDPVLAPTAAGTTNSTVTRDHPLEPPAAPPASGTPTTWNLRLGYRLTVSDETAHGIQVVIGPTFKLGGGVRLTLGVESNLMFLYSDSDPETLGRDDIVGEHFEGVRESSFNGSTYTDVTGGTLYENQLLGWQTIPEVQLMWRPSEDVPFEMGFRAGFIANYSLRHTRTNVEGSTSYPGEHVGGDGCIPGDMYCGDGPIPTPGTGGSYGPFEEDVAKWEFTGRFGPRLNFPFTNWMSASTELLFIGSNKEDGGLDLQWRSGLRFVAPIHDNFQLAAEPRYVLRRSAGETSHGFDLVAGTNFKW